MNKIDREERSKGNRNISRVIYDTHQFTVTYIYILMNYLLFSGVIYIYIYICKTL